MGNTSWVIAQHVVQMLVSLVVGSLSARYLGPANYGSINYAASFVSLFSSITSLGMDGVIIKKMVDHPEREGEYLGSCLGFRMISGLFSMVSILSLVYFLNPGETATFWICALYSISVIFHSFETINYWFRRHLKSKYPCIAKIIAYLVMSAYKIYLLATGKSVYWFALSNVLDHFVLFVVVYLFYRKNKAPSLRFSFHSGMEVLKESYHFILSGLMVALYGQMDRIMLNSMLGQETVGFYSAANTICTMWIFVPSAMINSSRPLLMEMKKKDEGMYLRRLKQLYSALIWLCIAVSFGVLIFGPLAIRILYGSAFDSASNALRILIWCEVFSMIGSARGIWIITENKNKYIKYYLIYGVAVNAVLNLILIPRFGICGAAVATLVTQVVTSLIAPLFYKETRIHTKYVIEAFLLKWFFEKNEKKEL